VTRRVERACQRQETGVALPGGADIANPQTGRGRRSLGLASSLIAFWEEPMSCSNS